MMLSIILLSQRLYQKIVLRNFGGILQDKVNGILDMVRK